MLTSHCKTASLCWACWTRTAGPGGILLAWSHRLYPEQDPGILTVPCLSPWQSTDAPVSSKKNKTQCLRLGFFNSLIVIPFPFHAFDCCNLGAWKRYFYYNSTLWHNILALFYSMLPQSHTQSINSKFNLPSQKHDTIFKQFCWICPWAFLGTPTTYVLKIPFFNL